MMNLFYMTFSQLLDIFPWEVKWGKNNKSLIFARLFTIFVDLYIYLPSDLLSLLRTTIMMSSPSKTSPTSSSTGCGMFSTFVSLSLPSSLSEWTAWTLFFDPISANRKSYCVQSAWRCSTIRVLWYWQSATGCITAKTGHRIFSWRMSYRIAIGVYRSRRTCWRYVTMRTIVDRDLTVWFLWNLNSCNHFKVIVCCWLLWILQLCGSSQPHFIDRWSITVDTGHGIPTGWSF